MRPSPAVVIASLALLVSLTGTSVAAVSQLAKNSVGTPQLKNNAVTSAKVKNRTLVRADFKSGTLLRGPAGTRGQTGATGATGATGPAGAPGASGAPGTPGVVTRLTAIIAADGTITRSQNVTSAANLGGGNYEVIFNQNVSQCTYVATPGSGVATPHGHISVAPRGGNPNGVFATTANPAGAEAALPFHLVVVC